MIANATILTVTAGVSKKSGETYYKGLAHVDGLTVPFFSKKPLEIGVSLQIEVSTKPSQSGYSWEIMGFIKE